MGTRGHIVIRIGKKCYVFYNNYDSYPDGLGIVLLHQVAACGGMAALEVLARALPDTLRKDDDSEDTDSSSYDPATHGMVRTLSLPSLLRYPHAHDYERTEDTYVMNEDDLIYIEWVYVLDFDAHTFQVRTKDYASPCMPFRDLNDAWLCAQGKAADDAATAAYEAKAHSVAFDDDEDAPVEVVTPPPAVSGVKRHRAAAAGRTSTSMPAGKRRASKADYAAGKVQNPATGKYVLETSALGRAILATRAMMQANKA